MADNELLLAISEMMDQKLSSELQPIKDDLHTVKEEVREVKEDLQSVKEEVREVKEDLQSVKEEVREVKEDLQSVKEEVREVKEDLQSVKEEVREVKEDLQSVKGDMQSLEMKVHQIKLCQENVILPRLNTIESCYTDTYRRYKKYGDRMEIAFDDIEILKRVVRNMRRNYRNYHRE